MPYVIEKRGAKFAVVNPETGRVFGLHASKKRARAQQKALYENAPPEKEK